MQQLIDQLYSPFSILFSLLLIILALLFIINVSAKTKRSSSPSNQPISYPIFGMSLSLLQNLDRPHQWMTDILKTTPSATFIFRRFIGFKSQIFTANPSNVKHILKTNFQNYPKGPTFRIIFSDFLGNGIFNADGETWKFQRQVASHEFNTKSLKKFIETVVDTELSDRLIPILSNSSASNSILDLQDILQRFAFDDICRIAFGYDPDYLSSSLPQTQFVKDFENSVRLTRKRFNALIPSTWKFQKFLQAGSEKELSMSVSEVRQFAQKIVKEKRRELQLEGNKDSSFGDDLLSRFLFSGHQDENFITDIVISFIVAGRDTTSAALTWFFWLISQHPRVEEEILKEITEKSGSDLQAYDEVKEMMYTHAALCETMRLYPPVPSDTKEALNDDVFPDGTQVTKGMMITYHPYAMGRMENLWGSDWDEFKPERWLGKDQQKWKFIGIDPYVYPVFQAGPRICLGKEMAFLQMKRVVGGVLRRFKVVPAVDGFKPVFVSYLTAKMKGGFPVKFVERKDE